MPEPIAQVIDHPNLRTFTAAALNVLTVLRLATKLGMSAPSLVFNHLPDATSAAQRTSLTISCSPVKVHRG